MPTRPSEQVSGRRRRFFKGLHVNIRCSFVCAGAETFFVASVVFGVRAYSCVSRYGSH